VREEQTIAQNSKKTVVRLINQTKNDTSHKSCPSRLGRPSVAGLVEHRPQFRRPRSLSLRCNLAIIFWLWQGLGGYQSGFFVVSTTGADVRVV
jgi:hypothetical protein